jgi:NAD(P)H-dependent FMN reductase
MLSSRVHGPTGLVRSLQTGFTASRLSTARSNRNSLTSRRSTCRSSTSPPTPALGNYAHEHTKRWSESVRSADAFVFVMPEYNFGPPPSLLNALNFVYREWNFAPAGFVSYGGVSGGTRAVQAVKSTISAVRMVPIPEGVAIPMVPAQIVDPAFKANELNATAARTMLDQLKIWTGALRQLRTTVR